MQAIYIQILAPDSPHDRTATALSRRNAFFVLDGRRTAQRRI